MKDPRRTLGTKVLLHDEEGLTMGSRSLTRFHQDGKPFASVYTHYGAREKGFLLASVVWMAREIGALAAEVCQEFFARYQGVALLPADVLPADIEWLYDITEGPRGLPEDARLRVTHRGVSIGHALGPERLVYQGPLRDYADDKADAG